MSYAIMRTKKLANFGSVGGAGSHIQRTRPTPNADPEKRNLNVVLVGDSTPITSQLKKHIQATGAKLNKNSPPAFEVLLTGSPEKMAEIEKSGNLKSWAEANVDWLQKQFGANVISAVVHRDEKTPHIHAIVCPVVTRFDKRAKQDVARVTCKEYLGGRAKMTALQDSYGEAMAPFALDRGVRRSRAKHTEVQAWYGAQHKAVTAAKKTPSPVEPLLELPPPSLTESRKAFALRVAQAQWDYIEPQIQTLKNRLAVTSYALENATTSLSTEKGRVSAEAHGAREEAIRQQHRLAEIAVENEIKANEMAAKAEELEIKASQTESRAVRAEWLLRSAYAQYPDLDPDKSNVAQKPSQSPSR